METGTKNEVTVQQGTGFAEEIEDVGHRSIFIVREVDNLARCCGHSIFITSTCAFFSGSADKGEALVLSIQKLNRERAISGGSSP
jgi:hypothetical protein